MDDSKRLGSRAALVQGASRGIGLALVRRLLARPDVGRVVATSRRPEQSADLCTLREEHGEALSLVALDVRDEASLAAAARELSGSLDRLHLLINCAGLLHDGDEVQPEKRIERIDPAVLRPGRLDLKVKVQRPDVDAARSIFQKYLTADLPFHAEAQEQYGSDAAKIVDGMINETVERMYSTEDENKFLRLSEEGQRIVDIIQGKRRVFRLFLQDVLKS